MSVRASQIGRWLLAPTAAMVLALASGCSSGGVTTYPVTGKVVGPGGKAWTGGKVTFQSVADPAVKAGGDVQPDGSFSLTTYLVVDGRVQTKPGAVAGEHTVTVEDPERPGDRRGGGKAVPLVLPQRYRVEAKDNALVIEVPRPIKALP
jgi:hypothetical protein